MKTLNNKIMSAISLIVAIIIITAAGNTEGLKQTVMRAKARPYKQKAKPVFDKAEMNRKAEKLYQTALHSKQLGTISGSSYEITIACCQQIVKKYPRSSYVEKAKELLKEVPAEYIKKYEEEASYFCPREPKVQKSKHLRDKQLRMPRTAESILADDEL